MRQTVKPSTYLAVLAEKALEVIKILITKKIENKIFWEHKDGWIGPSHCDYPLFTQSRELKKLGGIIKKGGGRMVEWQAPKDSRLYELIIGIIYPRSIVYYYLLRLGDGREFFLKQGRRSIQTVKLLPVPVYRQLILKILEELRGEFDKKEINKITKEII